MNAYALTDAALEELDTARALFVSRPESISTVQNFNFPVFVRIGGASADDFRLYTDTYGVAQLAARLGAPAVILSDMDEGHANAFRSALDEAGATSVFVYLD